MESRTVPLSGPISVGLEAESTAFPGARAGELR
jgi:hypothetical protein